MDEKLQTILASLVFFVFGIGLILLDYFTGKKRRYIKKNGILTEGEIVDYNMVYSTKKTLMGKESFTYHITCKYTTSDQKEITKQFLDMSYRKKWMKKHPLGSKIKIIYLQEKPHESIVKTTSLFTTMMILMRLTGIGLIIFSLYFPSIMTSTY